MKKLIFDTTNTTEVNSASNGQLLYLRHGETYSNVADTFSGMKDDTSLTPKGEEQARLAGKNLAQERTKIDRIIASPLKRAQRTASLVAEVTSFDLSVIETESRLTEYDMGELTGKPRTEVTSVQLIAAKGAEDPDIFMDRVSASLDDMKDYEGTILIVAHAGVGRIIRCRKEGLDPAKFYDLSGYPNATIVKL